VTAFGFDQINNFMTTGLDAASGPTTNYKSNYGYPLYCDSIYSVDPTQGNITLNAHLIQGLELEIDGNAVFPTGLEAFAAIATGQQTSYSTLAGSAEPARSVILPTWGCTSET
jgi:hypothetical protein